MRPWYCKPFKPNRDWLAKYPTPAESKKSTNIYGVPPYRAEIPGTYAPKPFDVPRHEIERLIEERKAYELARMQGLIIEPPLSALM